MTSGRGIVGAIRGALLCVTLLGVSAVFSADGAAAPSLFGTKEIRSTKLVAFPKWTGMLERYFRVTEIPDEGCDSPKFTKCHLAQWENLIATLSEEDPATQIREVHRYFNQVIYITDIMNWGVPDYWATPYQFRVRDGDCEDYAIAKYMTLRALGYDASQMRIVVVQDMNLRIPHAVLAVYFDGEALILDNQIEPVLPSHKIRHYKVYYSLNEDAWWLHQG